MIANETIDSYLHRVINKQDTTNIVFIRHSTFHAYQGFDTLALALRFWHLVARNWKIFFIMCAATINPSKKKSSDRSPLHSYEWLSSSPFSKMQKDQHTLRFPLSGYKILINKVSLAYRGYDTLIPAQRLRHLISHAYQGYDTLIPTPRFWHLVSLAYWGYDTVIPAPRF